jgi:hypothetical protein
MRWILLILLPAFLVGGCASGANALMDRPATLKYRDPPTRSAAETELAAIQAYHGDASQRQGMSQREYRDSIIYRQLAADDDDFGQFVRNLRSDKAKGNIATDIAVLALNGISAVTGGAQTKATLAVISGGLIGAKGSIDKELFNLEALSAIVSRMKAARLKALVPIKTGLNQDTTDYSLEQALFDLRGYANAGTLSGALSAITNDAGEEAEDAAEDIRTLTRTADFRDAQPQKDTLRPRVKALSNDQTLALAFVMQSHLAERSDSLQRLVNSVSLQERRLQTPASARHFLLFWLQNEEGAGQLQQWADALDDVEEK